jgi:predicted nucleic acid-binding protein
MSEQIVLDTAPLILHLRAGSRRASPLTQLDDDVELLVSGISVAELWQGATADERLPTQSLVDRCTIVPVNTHIARAAGELVASLRAQGRALTLPDGLVAATSVGAKAPLWTMNVKDFRDIPGLELLSI